MLPHISFPLFIFFVILCLLYTGFKIDPFASLVGTILGLIAMCFFGMFLGMSYHDIMTFFNWFR
jgi:hypothetical protein